MVYVPDELPGVQYSSTTGSPAPLRHRTTPRPHAAHGTVNFACWAGFARVGAIDVECVGPSPERWRRGRALLYAGLRRSIPDPGAECQIRGYPGSVGVQARARRERRAAAAAAPALAIGEFSAGARIETTRRCRICKCSEGDRCWEARKIPHPLAPSIPISTKSYCKWVSGNLCSFCAEDGGPPHVIGAGFGPECYSTLVDRFGNPYLLSKYLPRE